MNDDKVLEEGLRMFAEESRELLELAENTLLQLEESLKILS